MVDIPFTTVIFLLCVMHLPLLQAAQGKAINCLHWLLSSGRLEANSKDCMYMYLYMYMYTCPK